MNAHANTKTRAGFTVIELMITVAVVAILSAIATPSLRDLVKNARMTSLVNDLMSDLNIARAEAVKRGVPVSVCTSNTGKDCTPTGWKEGWIVFTDGGPEFAGAVYGKVNTGLLKDPATDTPLLDVILKVSPKINGADETTDPLIWSEETPTEGTAKYVNFRPSGVTKAGGAAASTMHFYLCDSRKAGTAGVSASEALNKGRHIVLTATGRAQSNRCTCESNGKKCNP